MKNNIKNIAYIQNLPFLNEIQIKKYLGNIKNLTSNNTDEIYKFIVCCNNCYKITNFCLNINSKNLSELNELIRNNRKLDKCIFAATRSNANNLRKTLPKNIYFSLSSLDVILQNYKNIEPFKVMTIVSDLVSPFYNQIYIEGPKPAYRISELTVEKVNEFVDKGNGIDLLIALNNININEFLELNKILLDPACKYRNFATFIELELEDLIYTNKLRTKLATVDNIASNVTIVGFTESYPDINPITLYVNCAIQLVNTYYSWSKYINNSILYNRFINKKNKLKNIKGTQSSSSTSSSTGGVASTINPIGNPVGSFVGGALSTIIGASTQDPPPPS
jgi:hypothetical protein